MSKLIPFDLKNNLEIMAGDEDKLEEENTKVITTTEEEEIV